MTQELMAAEDVERIGLKFIQGVYYRGKVSLTQTRLVTEGAFPVYHLEGSINASPRNILGRLISPDSPYSFKIQVHAIEGSILDYELR